MNVRRPVGYLCVAAVLSAASLLLPAGPPAATATPAPPTASPAPAAPGCTGIRASLRPTGPLPAPGAMPPGSTMARIAARGRLIVGVDQSKYLMSFRDPATGELEGSDIDVAKLIATAIFGDPNRIQFVAFDIADRIPAIQRDQVDLVVDSFTVTCERQRDVEFSTAYLPAAQRLLVPRGSSVREIEDLAGGSVCTSVGATSVATLRALALPIRVVTRPSFSDCMVDLQRGRVEAITTDALLLAGLAAQDPDLKIVGRTLLVSDYAVGASPTDPDLVRFVNAVLERARIDGSLAASDQRWYGVPVAIPPALYRD